MVTNEVELDPVLHALGPTGLFACVQCCLFYLGYFSDAHQLFSYVFTGKAVEHLCAPPPNGTFIPGMEEDRSNSTIVHYDQCAIVITSNVSGEVSHQEHDCLFGMTYAAPRDSSIVSEFDLVCQRAPLAGLTQTLFSLGTGFGAIFFPWLSDLYGRRRIIMVTLSLTFVTTYVAGFAPSYHTFAVTKFLLGFLEAGIGLIGVTAGVELFPSSHRAVVSGFCCTLWWSLCIGSLSPIAYLLRHHSWRHLQFAISGSSAVVVLIIVFVKEPVRWLVANGKIEEAENVLKKAAKWNHKDFKPVLKLFRELLPNQEQSLVPLKHGLDSKQAESSIKINGETAGLDAAFVKTLPSDDCKQLDRTPENLGFLDLVRHPLLRKNALVSFVIWFVDSLTYFALYLMSDTLALNLYISFFLGALVEGASCILMIIMLYRIGRKPTIAVFHCLAGAGLIASSICFSFQGNSILQILGTITSLCGKMGSGGAFNVLFLYTPEIFPTNIRNRALGVSLAASTLGSMLAPYSGLLAAYAMWLPGAIFGTCSLLVIFLLLSLPESRGKELPQNVRDLEAW